MGHSTIASPTSIAPRGDGHVPMGLETTWLEAPDGTRCEAAVGHTGGRGVLFLHGYSFRYTVWLEPEIAQETHSWGVSVAAPDMPYGRSTSCTRRSRSLDTNLAVTEAALREAGISQAVAVGASLGARYAAYLAAATPRVEALVLTGPAPGREYEKMVEAVRRAQERGLHRVVVLVGSRERPMLRRQAEALARETGASLVVVEAAGHVVHRDQPRRFLETLHALLAELGYTA